MDFYVYVLLDQRKPGEYFYRDLKFVYRPFYVGVGRKYRMNSHFYKWSRSERNIKNNIITSIEKEIGELPIHYRIYENLEQRDAFDIEIDFIKTFGRIKNDTGVLSNLTDGGEGNLGLVHSEEYLNTLRKKVYQYTLCGDFVKEWNCLKDAQIYYKLPSIKQAIRNKGTSGGYQWRYEKCNRLDGILVHTPKVTSTFIMLDKKTKEEIKRFFSFEEVKNLLGNKTSFGNISSCASGRIKTAYGYKWKMV